MISINQATIYFNIAASIIFVTYIILNSIQPFFKKKVEIEKKNKVSNNVMTVNFKNDLIIKEVTLPELEKRNLSFENKKNLKLLPLKSVLKNKDQQSVKINPIDYNNLRAHNLNEKQNNLSILQPVALEKKIKSISIKPIKITSLRINDDKFEANVNNKELIKFEKSKSLSSLLIEFKNSYSKYFSFEQSLHLRKILLSFPLQ